MSDPSFAEKVRRLKDGLSGRQVAERLGLRGRGRRFFCPACQSDGGKTPDLSVSDFGFSCFKCGVKGDLIALVQLVNGADFKAATSWLAGDEWSRPVRRTRSEPDPVTVRPVQVADDAGRIAAYQVFLEGCRPVEGPALDFLTRRGISAEVIDRMGIRFCGREYADLIRSLKDRIDQDVLLAAGLLKPNKAGKVVPSFWHYFAKEAGFLVIPYLRDGWPVYLKVRPPINKVTAEAKGIIRFLNTSAAVPCPFNVDDIAGADRVLICEGESDTLAALSLGYHAVGIPGWSHFRPEWVDLFRGPEVFLVLDADDAGDRGVRDIASKFAAAGLPLPRQVELPKGMDLTDFINAGSNE